jgi:hypothetical protein
METAQLFASAGVSTGVIASLLLAWKVWNAIKGRRLVSDCCGKWCEVGIDVREMGETPPTEKKEEPEADKPPPISAPK